MFKRHGDAARLLIMFLTGVFTLFLGKKTSITLQKKTDITFPINTYSRTYLIITNKYLRPLLKTSSVIWTTTSSHISEQPGDINAALPEKTAYLHIF